MKIKKNNHEPFHKAGCFISNNNVIKKYNHTLNTICYWSSLFIQLFNSKSKEEGKDQESIQSSTTPNEGHHTSNKTQENIPYKRAKRSALSHQVTIKAAMNK